jgi:hypothetical protein
MCAELVDRDLYAYPRLGSSAGAATDSVVRLSSVTSSKVPGALTVHYLGLATRIHNSSPYSPVVSVNLRQVKEMI